jgi:AcrR family transcriptional regulator
MSNQERRQRRRAQILDGAAQVFARKGFHAATTREIAQAADVSEGTIYNYFDTKEDLLIHIMAQLTAGEHRLTGVEPVGRPDAAEQTLSIDIRDFLEDVLRVRQTFVAENGPMLRAVISEILIDRDLAQRYYQQLLAPTLDLLERRLQARIEQGDIRPVDVPLCARYFLATNLGLLQLLFLDDPILTSTWGSDQLVETLSSFLLDGLQLNDEERTRTDA